MKKVIQIAFVLLSLGAVFAQSPDITPYLKAIEAGNAAVVRERLPELKTENPGSPDVMFLDAALTEDGNLALKKYKIIIDKYPRSRYADAAMYRVFSYYYSFGSYKTADKYLERLKSEYPDSPYIKSAERKFPDEAPGERAPTPRAQPVYKYAVQAGAFLNRKNAEKLRDNLKADGYSAEIYVKNVGGSELNVVVAGKFERKSDADDLLKTLLEKYNLKGRVVDLSSAKK